MRRDPRRGEAGGRGAACLLIFLAALSPAGCRREPAPAATSSGLEIELEGAVMGTTWHVSLMQRGGNTAQLIREINEVLDRVDARMSTWKPDSELSRFAAAPAEERFTVSEETATVIAEALRTWALTDGAFDPTVMPLVDLWGFGPAGRELPTPDDDAVAAARARCGADKLRIDGDALVKDIEGLAIDLSAIAKGYAVDAVCARLIELGQEDFLVEVGGELRTAGSAMGDRPWRVGIDRPPLAGGSPAPGQSLQAILELGERAVATSGDYRNWREVDGVRISHTIDPRTGRPVVNEVASATVLAPSCMEADALATALIVLGADEGLALINRMPGYEAYLVVRDGDAFAVRTSAAFPQPVD